MFPLLRCTVLLLLLPTLSWAQNDSLPWSIDLTDVVVTAQYAPTEARNAIHRVRVLQRHDWEARGVNDLSELLQRQLNLQITPDPILGNGLSIQGIGGQNVQIMIDGVPVVGRLGGEIDLTQLNLSQFARVEIIAGAMSARYGSNAAGGVINLITAKELKGPWHLELGGQYESVNLDRQHLRIGREMGDFQLDGGLHHYAARFASEDSLRAGASPWNPKDQLGYDLNFRYRPSDSLNIHYGYRHFDETITLLGPVRRPRFRPYVIDDEFDTRREDHALRGSVHLSPTLQADLTAGYNTFTRHKRSTRRDLEADTTQLVAGGQDTTRYTGRLLRLSVATLGEGPINGQIGLEYHRETGAGGRILDTATLSTEPALTNYAAWLALRYRISASLTAEATARFGHNSRYDHPLIPALHFLWRPSEHWCWRFGYAAGFRAPSVQELFFNFIDANHYIIGSQSLAAERSNNFRLEGNWGGGPDTPLTIEAAAFLNHIKRRITIADLNGDNRFTYVNLDDYRTHGVTLQISYQPTPAWHLSTGGGLTRVSNQITATDADAPDYLSLGEWQNELSYIHQRSGTQLRLDHRYIGRRDRYLVGGDGEILSGYIGDYHLLHLTARKSLWKERIAITAGVKNLLNRDRVPVTGGSGGGAHSGGNTGRLVDFGRNFFVGIKLRY